MSATNEARPVTFPPGRARLGTSPLATGSPDLTNTMGIVPVALLAARAAGLLIAKITSNLRATSSAASAGSRSCAAGGEVPLDADVLALDVPELPESLPE